jgi:hypothetical protein
VDDNTWEDVGVPESIKTIKDWQKQLVDLGAEDVYRAVVTAVRKSGTGKAHARPEFRQFRIERRDEYVCQNQQPD